MKINLNWSRPHFGHKSNLDEDYISVRNVRPKIHDVKHMSIYLKFPKATTEKYLREKVNHISLAFEENIILMIINPTEDIPKLKMSSSKTDRLLYSHQIVNKVFQTFNIDEKSDVILLKIHRIGNYHGQELYGLTPHDNKTLKPMLQAERDGTLF